MKTFRFIGMALFAVLMCVNFASCSSDDDPTEESEEGEVVVSGKKITKIVGKSEDGDSEIYTFKYDNKGRLIEVIESYEGNGYEDTDTYQYIWGDDAVKCIRSYNDCVINLKNGLVQSKDYGDEVITFSYNKSNRLVQVECSYFVTKAIWDGDKLMFISNADDADVDYSFTYEKTCKKGYFPFTAFMIDDLELSIAHPEMLGSRTTHLPATLTATRMNYHTEQYESSTSTFAYEFTKDGYVSKIIEKEADGSTETYIITWQ